MKRFIFIPIVLLNMFVNLEGFKVTIYF